MPKPKNCCLSWQQFKQFKHDSKQSPLFLVAVPRNVNWGKKGKIKAGGGGEIKGERD